MRCEGCCGETLKNGDDKRRSQSDGTVIRGWQQDRPTIGPSSGVRSARTDQIKLRDRGGSRKLHDRTQKNGRTTQIPVLGRVVLGPRNQTGGFVFELHPVKVEHELVRCDNPSHDRFIFCHGLDLVLLERLRGVVEPILSDWEPMIMTLGQAISKEPGGSTAPLTTIGCSRVWPRAGSNHQTNCRD